MIIYYHCNSDNALLLSFLLTCHPYIPFRNDFYTCYYILKVSDLQKNRVDYKVLGMEPFFFSWRSKVFNFLSIDRAGS